jgi:hypothetical protein
VMKVMAYPGFLLAPLPPIETRHGLAAHLDP